MPIEPLRRREVSQKDCSMNDFTALVTQFGQWLQARNLDPKDYSLAIVARDQRTLAALQAELSAAVQREDWRPAWTTGGVEVHGRSAKG